jgi:hypothetical protein
MLGSTLAQASGDLPSDILAEIAVLDGVCDSHRHLFINDHPLHYLTD